MQFQVPQFIDIESKIVGPLTIKQFLYLAGAGGASFMLFFVLETWLWLIMTAILGGLGVALAFVKYNGQPLPRIIFHAFFFFWRPRLYLWKREAGEKALGQDTRKSIGDFLSEMPSVKKLWQDLTTSKAPIPKREKAPAAQGRFQLFRKISGERDIARRVDYR